MSAVLNSRCIYNRMVTVKTLLRLSQAVHPKHGFCKYCSSVPKMPPVSHNEVEQNNGDNQTKTGNKLLDNQKDLIKSIDRWYELQSKTHLSEDHTAAKTKNEAGKGQTVTHEKEDTTSTSTSKSNKQTHFVTNSNKQSTNLKSKDEDYVNIVPLLDKKAQNKYELKSSSSKKKKKERKEEIKTSFFSDQKLNNTSKTNIESVSSEYKPSQGKPKGKFEMLNSKRETIDTHSMSILERYKSLNEPYKEIATNTTHEDEMKPSLGKETFKPEHWAKVDQTVDSLSDIYTLPNQEINREKTLTVIHEDRDPASSRQNTFIADKQTLSVTKSYSAERYRLHSPEKLNTLELVQDTLLNANRSITPNSTGTLPKQANKQMNESLSDGIKWRFQDSSISKLSEKRHQMKMKKEMKLAEKMNSKLKAERKAKKQMEGNVERNEEHPSTWMEKMKDLTGQLAPSKLKTSSLDHSTVQLQPLKPVYRHVDHTNETGIESRSHALGEMFKNVPKHLLTSNSNVIDDLFIYKHTPNLLLSHTGEKTSLKNASRLFNFKSIEKSSTEIASLNGLQDKSDPTDTDTITRTAANPPDTFTLNSKLTSQIDVNKPVELIPSDMISSRQTPVKIIPSDTISSRLIPEKVIPSDTTISSDKVETHNINDAETSIVSDLSMKNTTYDKTFINTSLVNVNKTLQNDPLNEEVIGSRDCDSSFKATCDNSDRIDSYTDALDDMSTDMEKLLLDKLPMYVQKEKPKVSRSQWKAERDIALAKAHFTSYLEVSILTGMFSKALRDFEATRVSENTKLRFPVTLEMYNILLRGIANTNGDLEVMRQLCDMMENDGISLNIESFAYWLVRIGDTKEDALKYGHAILEQMKTEELDITSVFNMCELTASEASRIISVMHTLQPEVTLKPRFTVHDVYTEPLAMGLNTPAQLEPADISTEVRLDRVMDKSQIQFSRELNGYIKIPPVWEEDSSAEVNIVRGKQFEELLSTWRATVKEKFEEGLSKAKENAWCSSKYNIYPYLSVFPKGEYVDMLMDQAHELASFDPFYSPNLKTIQRNLGEIVYSRYKIHYNLMGRSTKALGYCYEEYLKRTLKDHQRCTKYREVWQDIAAKISPYTPMNLDPYPWDDKVKDDIGDFLLSILLKNLTFEHISKNGIRVNQKCFNVVLRLRDYKYHKEIQLHPKVQAMCNQSSIIKRADQIPMLCPPLPHISTKFGGNLLNTVNVMKSDSPRHVDWLNKLNPLPVLDSLTILSNSAWVINKPVLDVVLYLFKQGGAPELDIPLHPSRIKKPAQDDTHKAKVQYKKDLNNAGSLWYSEMYKYSIAEMFRDEVFWFPHAVDFRGRSYPLSIFNHQGNDVIRGLMKFAESKPLGEEGLDWLKIHLVNLTGLKKRDTLSERLKYTEEIMDDIADSADNPLFGKKWWMKSEAPIQTLAACIELMNALRSPNPKMFYSNFPIHQDGSCNGLQHYAALGLDVDGAKSVNLYPSETPSDVYSNVTEAIKEKIHTEIAENHENKEIAVLADRYLERKIIKQSVMTQVYGVTRYGVRNQILGQMKDTDCPEKMQSHVAFYLMQKCFQSLDSIFKSGKKIQSWFTRCSRIISIADETVQWVTPIQFPVIQSYYKKGFKGLDSSIVGQPVNKLKQTNGFPPNFIHSLDATHMMLTALYCHREGIRFGSVHDSFWTHAGDVATMNKITREQFVALHNQNILEDLALFFVENYEEIIQSSLKEEYFEQTMEIFRNVPEKGNFDLDLVKDSTYFFS